MATQAIASGEGTLCRYRTQAGDMLSLRSIQTLIPSLEYYFQKRNSLKTPHILPFLYPALTFNTLESPSLSIVKGSQSNDCRAEGHFAANVDVPYAEAESAENMPISWLMVHDVVIWFLTADFKICLSYREVVTWISWDPACRLVLHWATCRFHITK